VPAKRCSVTFVDVRGARHSIDLAADSLYEAVALALVEFRKCPWLEHPPSPAARLEVEVREPSTMHVVSVQQFQQWVDSTATTVGDRLRRERVRALLQR
jgi:hypothetical protein